MGKKKYEGEHGVDHEKGSNLATFYDLYYMIKSNVFDD
jgi:hypothetical protein